MKKFIGYIAVLAVMLALFVFVVAPLLTLMLASTAHPHDLAAWSDPTRDAWYRSLKVPKTGSSCCDLRDAASVDPDKVMQDVFGKWYVDLGSGYVPVPPDRVVTNPPSIDGLPYLFMMANPTQDSPNGIRCFVVPVPTY